MTEALAQATVPLPIRLRLGRAAVQVIADAVGADLLHIKGDAVHDSLRQRRTGTDIDVLVRPQHVQRLHAALLEHGWTVYSTFEGGSPFGHAQTYGHPTWAYLDVHRLFPGITLDADTAFERLWADRGGMSFGGVVCAVPGLTEQAVILALNAARNRGGADLESVWDAADERRRGEIRDAVRALEAETAFAAAIGELEDYRSRRDYLLWKAISQDGTRSQEWWGRIRAARTAREAWRTAARAPLVNVQHLEHTLGHAPSRLEIVREFFARPARGVRDALRRGRS